MQLHESRRHHHEVCHQVALADEAVHRFECIGHIRRNAAADQSEVRRLRLGAAAR